MDKDSNGVDQPTANGSADGGELSVIDQFRTDALSLLAKKQIYANLIRELNTNIGEGSIQLGEATEDLPSRIADLEKRIIAAATDLKGKEMVLKFAQISFKINNLAVDAVESPSKPPEDERHGNIVRQFERIYLAQTNYLKLLQEVSELEKVMRQKQLESLESIWKTRSLHSELEKLKEKVGQDGGKLKSQAALKLKDHLSKGIRMHTVLRRLFSELIFCSQVDWQSDPDLHQLVLKLDEKLEFE